MACKKDNRAHFYPHITRYVCIVLGGHKEMEWKKSLQSLIYANIPFRFHNVNPTHECFSRGPLNYRIEFRTLYIYLLTTNKTEICSTRVLHLFSIPRYNTAGKSFVQIPRRGSWIWLGAEGCSAPDRINATSSVVKTRSEIYCDSSSTTIVVCDAAPRALETLREYSERARGGCLCLVNIHDALSSLALKSIARVLSIIAAVLSTRRFR